MKIRFESGPGSGVELDTPGDHPDIGDVFQFRTAGGILRYRYLGKRDGDVFIVEEGW